MSAKTTDRPPYPKFDHNAKVVAAYNSDGLRLGDTGVLTYRVDERGRGSYHLTREPWLRREMRADNQIETPDHACTVKSAYDKKGAVVWVTRDLDKPAVCAEP